MFYFAVVIPLLGKEATVGEKSNYFHSVQAAVMTTAFLDMKRPEEI
jgi:hypothetical protein